jgi:hypothetical protein
MWLIPGIDWFVVGPDTPSFKSQNRKGSTTNRDAQTTYRTLYRRRYHRCQALPSYSPKKSGAKQTKNQASPSDDIINDVKPSGPASPKKATGKQAAKKWSKQDKIDILLKVVQTASPDWQVSLQPRFTSVLSLTRDTRMRYRLWPRSLARVEPRARCTINGGKPDSVSFSPLFLCPCHSFGSERQHILPSLKSDGRVMKSE